MDLKQLDTTSKSDAGAIMALRHPVTGAPLFDEESKEEVTITLLGVDSKKYQQTQHASATERLNRSVGKGGRVKLSTEQIANDSITLLVKATLGWDHVQEGGEELDFSVANARHIYEAYPWIRDQAEMFIEDRANFLGE